MVSVDVKKIYNKELSALSPSHSNSNYFDVILVVLFILSIVTILYTRLFFGIASDNWEVAKCNPKYIFYSGYIKQNPNSNSFHSTVDNFNDCIVKFNNQKNGQFSKILEENKLEHLQRSDNAVNTHNKLSRERVLQLQRQVNAKNEEFKLQIENVEQSRNTSALQNEIDKLNAIISDIKEYAHTYLTYAMMNFVFKYKISNEDDTSGNPISTSETCIGLEKPVCNSNAYCDYNSVEESCKTITKGNFYRQEALKINETIKNYFVNNKL